MDNLRHIVQTGHSSPITDIATDSLGRRLASGSEDATIQIWDICDRGTVEHCALLNEGHSSAVVQVAWAPHRFGSMLVSCALDQTVIVWSELADRSWIKAYTKNLPATPTSLSFAPHEHGLAFACATSNGRVHIFSAGGASGGRHEMQWDMSDFDAHANVCTCVSWAPFLPPGSLGSMPLTAGQQQQQQQQQAQSQSSSGGAAAAGGASSSSSFVMPPQRLATVGSERCVKIWRYAALDRHWIREELVQDDVAASWVEVAWAHNEGLPFTYVAAGSAEGHVTVWSQDGLEGKWKAVSLPLFADRITKLSWSHVGTFLLVSCADESASLWREAETGEWEAQGVVSSSRR